MIYFLLLLLACSVGLQDFSTGLSNSITKIAALFASRFSLSVVVVLVFRLVSENINPNSRPLLSL
jgi:hypothetical protein